VCGRYRFKDPQALAEFIRGLLGEGLTIDGLEPRWNAAPSQSLPVIASRDGVPSGGRMRWGLVPYWEKSDKPAFAPINARSEEAFAKPMFRQSVQRRRCLVPADGFYEWRRDAGGAKQPFCLGLKDERPFFFAGIHEEEVPGLRPRTFAILTTAPNALVARVHDRMPVILAGDAARAWLREGVLAEGEYRALTGAFPADGMTAWPVSTAVNSPRNDGPECSAPVDVRA
jgi:putative SOS response-associated peptidase YedK